MHKEINTNIHNGQNFLKTKNFQGYYLKPVQLTIKHGNNPETQTQLVARPNFGKLFPVALSCLLYCEAKVFL